MLAVQRVHILVAILNPYEGMQVRHFSVIWSQVAHPVGQEWQGVVPSLKVVPVHRVQVPADMLSPYEGEQDVHLPFE